MKQREAYIQKLHAMIDEWDAAIDRLAAKADQVEADSRNEYQRQMAALKQKRREIEKQLADINRSGEAAWEDIKSGLDLAWEAMNEAVKSAVLRFNR